jgi:asparagine synthase (glutamine-hydrolysing)
MCGIAGVMRFDGAPAATGIVEEMLRSLVHRGPDGMGLLARGSMVLGHRRLSIIDVAGSPQPMSSADGRLHVCFNGEIFNYRELRTDLAADGYAFRTNGDTEVLLALFERHGPEGVSRLRGQFAYAIYDEPSRELWLFRDRMGILPLYFRVDGAGLAFASEVKALLVDAPSMEIDEASVGEYLSYRSVPAPNTLFRGVRKLQAGHLLHCKMDGNHKLRRYWEIPRGGEELHLTDDQALDLVARALEEAVAAALVADVPVGAYLSGGVDSSLVVALMHKLRAGAPIETFSAGFADPRYDELPFARQVSEQFATRHHEVSVGARDFEELWPVLTWHRDGPISEPSDVAVYRLASLARSSVKVLLSGEGSDELFAGYPKYAAAAMAGFADAIPKALRTPLFRTIERALPRRAARARVAVRAMTATDEAGRFLNWFAPFTSYERNELCPAPERDTFREIWARARGDLVERMLYVDCHTWLSDNLLERGDRMAMAASVESRPPFLDHHLVELAFSLPSHLKLRGRRGKWIVKEVARRYLPTEIVDRRKLGFRVPLDAWFRGHLRELSRDMLTGSNSFVGSWMKRSAVSRILDDHESGRRSEEGRIWTLLGLEVWHSVFFRRERAEFLSRAGLAERSSAAS